MARARIVPRAAIVLTLLSTLPAASLPAGRASVLVVYDSEVEAYLQAAEAASAVLGAGAFRLVDLHAPTAARDLSIAMESPETRAAIAIGSRAISEVRARNAALPLVAALALRGNDSDAGFSNVDLEVPLAAQLAAMRLLWPGHPRVGLIRNPNRARFSAEALDAAVRREGFVPVVVNCDGPGRLVKVMGALRGKVDFVLCAPDSDLYNPITIKPLVMTSLEVRLPLIGFSSAFVRAGAAAGLYPDYRETGRQAAELALRLVRGEDRVPGESPRKIQIAVNQRITRLLGIEFRSETAAAQVLR